MNVRYILGCWLAGLSFGLAAGQTVTVPPNQVWEKTLAPGVTYRMEVDWKGPWLIHAIRFSSGMAANQVLPELAGGTVYEDNATKGRGTVRQIVNETHASAGINADFFPFTGLPLGLMVRSGELITTPTAPRAVFAWGPKDIKVGTATFQGTAAPEGGESFKIDRLNSDCPENELVLDTPAAGLALSKAPNLAVIVKLDHPVWGPSTRLTAVVQDVLTDTVKTPVSSDTAILVSRGTATSRLATLKPGQKITINLQTRGFDWEKIENAIGGGPFLVRDGKSSIDADEEGFEASFSKKRHPRTAVGKTAAGDLWLLVVDGRQLCSVGCSLDELASLMLRLGCTDAINLDGGGSSTFNLLGLTLNRPSDGSERPVANALELFFGAPAVDPGTFKLHAPVTLALTRTFDATILSSDGLPVPNREILWAATGSAWVDQGGTLHPLGPGPTKLFAYVRGKTLSAEIKVTGHSKPPLAKPGFNAAD